MIVNENPVPRVLLIGADTAGYIPGLHKGFQDAGYDVSEKSSRNPYGYDNSPASREFRINLLGRARVLLSRNATIKSIARGIYATLAFPVARMVRFFYYWPQVFRYPDKFEIVLYNGGTSLTGTSWEFAYLRRRGVKLIFVFHGSDVRPAYLNGAIWGAGDSVKLKRILGKVKEQHKVVLRAEKYASMIVCWAGITHFFSKSVYIHEDLGFPLTNWESLQENPVRAKQNYSESQSIKVLHAPSNPSAKGTIQILQTVERLRATGLNLEFRCLSGVANREILNALLDTDFVIDQAYADTAGGVLAAEAALLGVPCVIASFDSSWLKGILAEKLPPTCFINLRDLEEEITHLANDHTYRNRQGGLSKSYFTKHWHPHSIAGRYIQVLGGDIKAPKSRDPLTMSSPRGGYAPHASISEVVSTYIGSFGERALKLDHNPKLRDAVVKEFSSRKSL